MISFKKIEVIRIEFEDGVYCQIAPSDEYGDSRNFWLFHEGYAVCEFMFECDVKTDDEAVKIAVANASYYIPYLMEKCI